MAYRIFKGFSTQPRPNKSNIRQDNWKLYDYELVKRDLLNHLFTRKGERVMMPTFGTMIWDMIMEPFTDFLRDQIVNEVLTVIQNDSRVSLLDLAVNEFEHGIVVEAVLLYIPTNNVENFTAAFDRRVAQQI